MPRLAEPLNVRLWRKVDKSGPIPAHMAHLGPCWIWTGGRDQAGYGLLSGPNFTMLRTHRLAWELTHEPIPDGQLVCHHCDNPPCCNPEHLFVGDHADNARDRVAKGRSRSNTKRGETHPGAKLTDTKVRQIRALHAAGQTQTALSAQFNVSQSLISQVILRQGWAHIP